MDDRPDTFVEASSQKSDNFHKYGFHKLVPKQIEDYPGGYLQVAAYMSAAPDHALFRKFDYLSNLRLFCYQVDITELEKKLFSLNAVRQPEDLTQEHRVLLSQFDSKYFDYHKMLMDKKSLSELDQASPSQHQSFFNWMWGEKPLKEGADDFIYHASDFVCVRSDPAQDSIIPWEWLPLWILQTDRERQISRNPQVDIYSASRQYLVIKVLSAFMILGILAVVVILLNGLHGWYENLRCSQV